MLAADCSTTASVQVGGANWRTLQGVSDRRKKTTRRWPINLIVDMFVQESHLKNQKID